MEIYKTQTRDGHKLTAKEAKFIDEYVTSGNGLQSVKKAGYTTKAAAQKANSLLTKSYIADEIKARLEEHKSKSIAEAEEIMEYFTSVMRGEVKDQFGLDAPLSERTRAAQELAKRKIDIPNRLDGKKEATVTIKVDWGDDEEEQEGEKEEDGQ